MVCEQGSGAEHSAETWLTLWGSVAKRASSATHIRRSDLQPFGAISTFRTSFWLMGWKSKGQHRRISTVMWCWTMAALDSSFVEPYCLPCVNVSWRQKQTRQIQRQVGTQNCLASLYGLDLSNDSGRLSFEWGVLKRVVYVLGALPFRPLPLACGVGNERAIVSSAGKKTASGFCTTAGS
jgi:hypothetical protein